ncbi:TonB-dependent receptor [Sphingomonas sp. So64.6b]|uniref:TonB-dependent receptor n=1 Tax=Sphingomonas sp. So64.6b TaxID=2997354 RepID=UPI0015FEBAF7|nr:TonB-dependent receptor [Sphingomonas sp. So64.6b]QNA86613.1 TonB-dependent receptor [Sphingomonas sp. So64.6b]
MDRSTHFRLAATTALAAALFFSSAEQAQAADSNPVTQAPEAQATDSQVPSTSAEPVAEPAEERAEGDIVVTAQRREEKLKDVPISITAVTGEQLTQSGVSGSRDLALLAPGLTINTTGAAAQATVRGVGNTVVGGNSESPVAIYIDGVYISGQYFAVFDLANIESVQVLKGPQGTLFGRNATGGAILVTTTRPSDVFSGSVTASYANFDDFRIGGFISGPITENLSFDIAGNYHKDHGYARDVLRDTRLAEYEDKSIRGKLLFSPDSDTEVMLIGDYGRIRDETSVSLRPISNSATPGALIPKDPRELALTFDPYAITKGGGVSLSIMHDFGAVTVKSLTAYRKTENFSITDQDRVVAASSRIDTLIKDNYFTEEVTASSSNASPFQWIVGGFYYGDTVDNPTYSNVTTLLNNAHMQVDAYAIFGEGTYALTDRLKVTAGVRYSTENRTFLSRRNAGTPLTAFRSLNVDAWTPRVSVIYALNDNSNVYATYSKGFKSGLFPAATFNAPPVEPETITSYEVGYKLAAGPTSLNLSAFYYDYQDLQITTRNPAGLQTLLNAANAEIYGLDADFSIRLAQGLRVRLAGAYTHAKYKKFDYLVPFFRELPAGGNTTYLGDASGKTMIRAPEFTGNAGIRYETAIGAGKVDASADYYYNSGFVWTLDNDYRQRPYSLINAQLGWSPDGDHFRLSVFGRNLTNTLYSMGTSVTNAATAAAYARPRSYGVAASFKF